MSSVSTLEQLELDLDTAATISRVEDLIPAHGVITAEHFLAASVSLPAKGLLGYIIVRPRVSPCTVGAIAEELSLPVEAIGRLLSELRSIGALEVVA